MLRIGGSSVFYIRKMLFYYTFFHIFGQQINTFFSSALTIFSHKRFRIISPVTKLSSKLLRFFFRTAEDQSFYSVSTVSVVIGSFQNMIYSLIGHQIFEVFKFCFTTDCFAIYLDIRDSEIMERTEQIVFQCMLQPDLCRNIVIKQLKNIKAIGSFRAGRHA